MKHVNRWTLIIALGVIVTTGGQLCAQTAAQKPKPASGQQALQQNQDMNIRAYIELLRTDVKSQAKSIIAEVMDFSGYEAERFWPIYKDY